MYISIFTNYCILLQIIKTKYTKKDPNYYTSNRLIPVKKYNDSMKPDRIFLSH